MFDATPEQRKNCPHFVFSSSFSKQYKIVSLVNNKQTRDLFIVSVRLQAKNFSHVFGETIKNHPRNYWQYAKQMVRLSESFRKLSYITRDCYNETKDFRWHFRNFYFKVNLTEGMAIILCLCLITKINWKFLNLSSPFLNIILYNWEFLSARVASVTYKLFKVSVAFKDFQRKIKNSFSKADISNWLLIKSFWGYKR